ncbi:hypothetical protein J2Z21_009806 [Streptomyces griseochromogenes]|uniref:Uncharacterized protein n=1 Tax=Streptomyces griseochromogenes TaxID=68214 RepID=A0ABS4MAT2_9ACTN|nr:hypothetical protein [Streptomyces griseochromogenes]MBP2056787.1 hypothetical protein [Streptomyces griseochromogenes]
MCAGSCLLATGRLTEVAVTEHNGLRPFRSFAAIRHPEASYDEVTGIGQGDAGCLNLNS